MKPPKVFVSYSHDSQDHKAWVLKLGERLMENGIDVIIDQWDLHPGDDIPMFMERSLASADYILMICSKSYVTKSNSGVGGVGYERMIITAGFMDRIDEAKVIPIIRQNGTQLVPIFLKTKLFIDLSLSQNFEQGINGLIRKIHNYPVIKKALLGGMEKELDITTDNRNNESPLPSTNTGGQNMSAILKITIGFATISAIIGVLGWLNEDKDLFYGAVVIGGFLSFICFIAYLISLIKGSK